MKNDINIADNLKLKSNSVTEKLRWLGTTGSGKTYGASKLAEEFWHAGAQFVVLDPVGVWYGLRLAKDGKKPSDIDIPIFGGLHGDIPLEATSGAMIADLIVDKNLSIILDVSQFESDASKARFAGDFAARFFFRKKASPSAVHLFIEECQEFVPQNPQRGEEKMLHEYIRMWKLGRNFGIGGSFITQRPQEVNKKALNMSQTLFVFRTTGTHERKAIEQWIADKSLDQDIAQDLPKLATGTCHVWSPEFLKISETAKILEKKTFNASATPEVGKSAKVVRMADINIPAIKDAMAATIEKAKSEDPKLLRSEISKLKLEMGRSNIKHAGETDKKVVELAVALAIKNRDKEWEKVISGVRNFGDRMAKIIHDGYIKAEGIGLPQFSPPGYSISDSSGSRTQYPGDATRVVQVQQVVSRSKVIARMAMETPYTDADQPKPLSAAARKVLTYLHNSYPNWKSKAQCWIAAGYAPSGSFNNSIYELTGAGYIEKDGTGKYAARRDSYESSVLDDTFSSSLDQWDSKLGAAARKIFHFLLGRSDITSKETLAVVTGYAPSGSFNNAIYELTGKELVIKNGTGYQVNPEALDL